MNYLKKTVLLSDNHLGFLATRVEYLENAGYNVVTATNPENTNKAILSGKVHLAILSTRLWYYVLRRIRLVQPVQSRFEEFSHW